MPARSAATSSICAISFTLRSGSTGPNGALVDDGWYALGHCHLRNDIRMFAIQRVLSSRETGETFDRPADFRVEEYLKGGFRAVRGDGAYHVVLRFRPEVARRFEERPWRISPFLERQPDGSRIVRSSSRASLRRIHGRSCGRPERSRGLQGDVG
jgi:predicted DNA-binding transcriptional regulator YafY